MQNLIKPVFIMSSERSGSNLLRTLLDNHSKLFGPKAPQLLKSFDKILPYYAKFGEQINISRLFDDMRQILNHPFHDWKVKEDVGKESVNCTHFLDLWQLFYSDQLKKTVAKHIVCKENNIFDFAFELLNVMPTARFIYLYRDPRDVASSWMKVPLGFKNVNQAAMNWHAEQMKCIKTITNFNLPVQSVSYEALIGNTPKEMTRILGGLDLDVEEACFQTEAAKGKELKWNTYWENLEKPVMSDNAGKYRKSLSEEEIEIIETRTKASMEMLGYKTETNANWQTPDPSIMDKLYYSKLNNRKPKYKNKNVEASVDAVILDRAAKMKEIRNNIVGEWKAYK